jgi:hypothetical protein
MEHRADRLARNEALFREANERIEDRVEDVEDNPDTRAPFLCECPEVDCAERVALTLREYERVRSEPTWFLVAPGHEHLEVEDVIERHETFLLVRKRGKAGQVARELDERSG